MGFRGDRLAYFRKTLNLKQADLAEKLGIGQNQISRYERGFMSPTIETVIQMAELFNTTSDYLLGLSNKVNPDDDEIQPDLSPTEIDMLAILRKYHPTDQARLVEAFKLMYESRPKE